MKKPSFLLTIIFILFINAAFAQDTQFIKQTLLDWNKAILTKNIEMATSMFDNNAKVILVGSEENEIHKGNSEIRHFLEDFFSKPINLSWDLTNVTIDQNKETAWVFVDGTAALKQDNGSTVTTPVSTPFLRQFVLEYFLFSPA